MEDPSRASHPPCMEPGIGRTLEQRKRVQPDQTVFVTQVGAGRQTTERKGSDPQGARGRKEEKRDRDEQRSDAKVGGNHS